MRRGKSRLRMIMSSLHWFPGLNQLILTVEFGIDSITIGFLPGGNVAFIKLGGLDTKLGW